MTMLTLFAIMRSPLIIGGEMTGFDDFTMSLITNEGILRIHRNSRHAHQIFRRKMNGTEFVVWYAALFNAGDNDADLSLPLSELEICRPVSATEWWTGQKVTFDEKIDAAIPAHGVRVYYCH